MPGALSAPSILVVDDDQGIHRLITRALRGKAAGIFHASNPCAAVEVVQRDKSDIVFLDLMFPGGVSGPEVVGLLRQAACNFKPDLAIFTVSGAYRSLPEIIELYRAGAHGVFSKPFDVRAVQAAVEATAGTESKRCASGSPVADAPAAPVVLILSDDARCRGPLSLSFQRQGFVVHSASYGSVGLIVACKLSPDAVILDMDMIPDLGSLDGVNVLSILKASPQTSGAVVAMVSGRRSPGQELRCVKAGASFFYPKGAHDWNGVAAQIKGRLCGEACACQGSLSSGRLVLALNEKRAFVDGSDIGLGAREFELLAYLIKSSPRVVKWQELQEKVWGSNGSNIISKQPAMIHATLTHLRQKLGPSSRCLVVHKFVGLRFGAL
jgi:DNA-binding response OmpR family regulator